MAFVENFIHPFSPLTFRGGRELPRRDLGDDIANAHWMMQSFPASRLRFSAASLRAAAGARAILARTAPAQIWSSETMALATSDALAGTLLNFQLHPQSALFCTGSFWLPGHLSSHENEAEIVAYIARDPS